MFVRDIDSERPMQPADPRILQNVMNLADDNERPDQTVQIHSDILFDPSRH